MTAKKKKRESERGLDQDFVHIRVKNHVPRASIVTLDRVPRDREGRPTKYHPQFAEMAKRLCMLFKDCTDKRLAEIFGVCEKTLNNWKQNHPEFLQSLKAGKIEADAHVVASLHARAVGMQVVKTHFSQHEGRVTAIEYLEEIPPETKAISLWLRNRQGQDWKEVFGHTDGQGGAFSIVIHHDLHPDDKKPPKNVHG
jgi:diadenosine tetraphosphatase ApaH/serine/threonine PP2A family protein phosphatase